MSAAKRCSDQEVVHAYEATGSVYEAGRRLGIHGSSVHERLKRLGVNCQGNGKPWSPADQRQLLAEYTVYRRAGRLSRLAATMGRTRHFICKKAKEAGLTDPRAARIYSGKWKYMTEQAARLLMDEFKGSPRNMREFCHAKGYDELGFSRTLSRFFQDEWEPVIESKAKSTSHYRLGRQFEYRVRDDLKRAGFLALRSPRSAGPFDLIAVRQGCVLLVQCKIGGYIPPSEWNELYRLAASVGAIPILAARGGFRDLGYWKITSEKATNGSKQHQPREPFQVPSG